MKRETADILQTIIQAIADGSIVSNTEYYIEMVESLAEKTNENNMSYEIFKSFYIGAIALGILLPLISTLTYFSIWKTGGQPHALAGVLFSVAPIIILIIFIFL